MKLPNFLIAPTPGNQSGCGISFLHVFLQSLVQAAAGVTRLLLKSFMKMAKIIIDTNIWVTQKEYAKTNGKTKQVIANWIKRSKLQTWHIKVLCLKPVKK